MEEQFKMWLQAQAQQNQAKLQAMPQMVQAAQAISRPATMGSNGTVLSSDPVQREQQAADTWAKKFPGVEAQAARLGMTPEALQASRGNDAMNQWGQAGAVRGLDPVKLREMNQYVRSARAYGEAQRSGQPMSQVVPNAPIPQGEMFPDERTYDSEGRLTSRKGQYGEMQVSHGSENENTPPHPLANIPAEGYIVNAAEPVNAEGMFPDVKSAVIGDAPRTATTAPSTQGSPLVRGISNVANALPNTMLAAGSTMAETLGGLLGNPFDAADINFGGSWMDNLKQPGGLMDVGKNAVRGISDKIGLTDYANTEREAYQQGEVDPTFSGNAIPFSEAQHTPSRLPGAPPPQQNNVAGLPMFNPTGGLSMPSQGFNPQATAQQPLQLNPGMGAGGFAPGDLSFEDSRNRRVQSMRPLQRPNSQTPFVNR
jgi:hypothetical protein